ncbi:hypothetical protein K469DRAFT_631630 [Zopfia rhizophila CBS 207.26]|uniref:BRCT domain-containing protein n=1 Tax=Zopfia rhizophila CBS 207.26 TaxID=1314779 RepID=A0A6A6E7A0_9PEZI|nr:hypothetical protein K469DRAFT_631630 [Zopfia rhizophila CBS 207.26]
MPWKFLEKSQSSQHVAYHDLKTHKSFDIVLNRDDAKEKLSVVGSDETPHEEALARITLFDWGIKLAAIEDDVAVYPAYQRVDQKAHLPVEKVKLAQKIPLEKIEIIFLRESDRVCFSQTSASLTLQYDPTVVQVGSSIGVAEEVPESEEQQTSTEDDEDEDLDLDRKVTAEVIETTQSNPQPSRATPGPSAARSEIVEETPTSKRIGEVTDAASKAVEGVPTSDSMENTPPPEDHVLQEMFSTAPSKVTTIGVDADGAVANGDEASPNATMEGHESAKDIPDEHEIHEGTPKPVPALLGAASPILGMNDTPTTQDDETEDDGPVKPRRVGRKSAPSIQIPVKSSLKRLSPTSVHETDSNESSPVRPNKRAKKGDDDSQDGRLSNIVVDASARKSASKRKGRVLSDAQETTPATTAIESQETVPEENLYRGPKPVVAFSNSGIQDNSSFIKFLKAHGGTKVDSAKDGKHNILCVKPGTLKKSTKLLLSIALGVPIVTDEWLKESAKKNRFLDTKSYIPEVPQQEEEWSFSMSNIWGEPQSDLLEGKIVYFTPALKKMYEPFKEVEDVCKAVGARRVIHKPGKEVKDSTDTIILALEEGDPDAVLLAENGHTCYHRDLLTISILRGEFDLESDEFKIKPVSSQQKKRGRPRKS